MPYLFAKGAMVLLQISKIWFRLGSLTLAFALRLKPLPLTINVSADVLLEEDYCLSPSS